MLARVTSGKSGIVEYLVSGIKSGRELGRDELDYRVAIDGNINITDSVIKQLNDQERDNNYLHITLSFSEKSISNDEMIAAYHSYKEKLMAAYDYSEFNVYAEIHNPKIKSYTDKKTGEEIERFPHVHIVIPKKNLITGKSLEPLGKYTNNIKYHDAIQESVNRSQGLQSPYDHQRKQKITDNSEFISRYKGDNFKGSNAEVKTEILEKITSGDIKTMSHFEKLLREYGEVSIGKAKGGEQYYKVKMNGESKNIRFKEAVFKEDYIVRRESVRQKPSDNKVNNLVNEWVNVRAEETKFIHPSSQTNREQYYKLNKMEREQYLNDRRAEYNKENNIGERGRKARKQSGFERTQLREFAGIRNGLPSLPERGLVRAASGGQAITTGVLPNNASRGLDTRSSGGNRQLRRSSNSRGRRGIESGIGLKDSLRVINSNAKNSLTEQMLKNHFEEKEYNDELQNFKIIRKNLEPERLLKHLQNKNALVLDNYSFVKAKDGSPRIKIENRSFNVSDFCTRHLHMSWEETKDTLINVYTEQQEEKSELREVNTISFVSDYVTSNPSKRKLSRLDESIMVLKYLQNKEKYEAKTMSTAEKIKTNPFSNNEIENADELNLKNLSERYKKQKLLQDRLSLKMGDLVAVKDVKNQAVDFVDKNTGDKVFTDTGEKIILKSRQPTDDHVVTAMTLAAEKFGSVSVTGTKDFKQQAIDVAVVKDLKITFKDKNMQQQFLESKEEYKLRKLDNNVNQSSQDKVNNEIGMAANNENVNSANDAEKALKIIAQARVEFNKGNIEKAEDLEASAAELARFAPKDKNSQNPFDQNKEPMLHRQFSRGKGDLEIADSIVQLPKLVKHGEAPYLDQKGADKSYFVELDNGQQKWGKGLKEAIEKSGAKIGDRVDIYSHGSKDVTVPVQTKNEKGDVVSTEMVDTKYKLWTVKKEVAIDIDDNGIGSVKSNVNDSSKDLNRALGLKDRAIAASNAGNTSAVTGLKKESTKLAVDAQSKQNAVKEEYKTGYSWNSESKKMDLRINNQHPSTINESVLRNIIKNDKYLKAYSFDDVKNGSLDAAKAKAPAVSKNYTADGEVVASNTTKNTSKIKQ